MSELPSDFVVFELKNTIWHVPNHFDNLDLVGSGAYGQVCSAVDKRSGNQVAIKKLSRPFQSVMHAKRAYREIRLLRHMKHENVISLIDTFTPQTSLGNFEDVYLVTSLMGADLNNIMKVQHLTDEHVQFLIYQLLRGLKYIHSAAIIHRDLKPSNLAVNENCELKILDFGLARLAADDSMTGYVATRWYRAPEIMLNWMQYDEQVDVWSVGCIMAELLSGKALFPGNDHIDQLSKIMQLVGKPSDEFLNKIISDNARNYIKSMPNFTRKDFKEWFPNATPEALDVLGKMLSLDPSERFSCTQCLEHPYFAAYHDPDDEPTAERFNEGFQDGGDGSDLGINELKELMWKEIESFVYTPPVDEMMDE